jgi:hypothetical protein
MVLASRVVRARWCRKVVSFALLLLLGVFSSEGGRERVRSMKGEMKRSRVRMPRV